MNSLPSGCKLSNKQPRIKSLCDQLAAKNPSTPATIVVRGGPTTTAGAEASLGAPEVVS